jgi:hypothetical protein
LLVLAGCGDEGDQNEVPEGQTIEVAGVDYTVYRTRQLNPRASPDDGWYDGPRVPSGKLLYASFVKACNPRGEAAAATGQLQLRDSFGNVYEPVELDADNPFDYEARTLDVGDCVPAEGSTADLPGGGGLVVFQVPAGAPENRPWTLRIQPPVGASPDAEAARVELDL